MPIPGKSAIEVEQPLSASADTNSTATGHNLIVRSTGIRPEVPYNLSRRFMSLAWRVLVSPLMVRALQRQIVRLRQFHRNRSNPDVQTQIFKPLSPETIKALSRKPNRCGFNVSERRNSIAVQQD